MHPAYIVGENDRSFSFFGITHSSKKGKGHKNHRLRQNPNPKDSKPAYIRKRLEEDRRSNFSSKMYSDYRMSEEDDKFIDEFLRRKKTKKRK